MSFDLVNENTSQSLSIIFIYFNFTFFLPVWSKVYFVLMMHVTFSTNLKSFDILLRYIKVNILYTLLNIVNFNEFLITYKKNCVKFIKKINICLVFFIIFIGDKYVLCICINNLYLYHILIFIFIFINVKYASHVCLSTNEKYLSFFF